jgi:hypothetical protein
MNKQIYKHIHVYTYINANIYIRIIYLMYNDEMKS